jgi:hypothetical protein
MRLMTCASDEEAIEQAKTMLDGRALRFDKASTSSSGFNLKTSRPPQLAASFISGNRIDNSSCCANPCLIVPLISRVLSHFLHAP